MRAVVCAVVRVRVRRQTVVVEGFDGLGVSNELVVEVVVVLVVLVVVVLPVVVVEALVEVVVVVVPDTLVRVAGQDVEVAVL